MHLTVRAPFDTDHHAQVAPPPGVPLGVLVGSPSGHITCCQVNGEFVEEWGAYVPALHDRVTLFVQPQEFISLTAILTAVITSVIATAISIGLSYLIRALTPTKSQTEGKPEQVYGIAGLTNTTAQGTPKLLCYGKRRIYGHILSTRVFVTGTAVDDGDKMLFSILYFMGEGPIQSLTQPQIDDIDVSQYTGITYATRLGGVDNATLIHPDFTTFSQVWSDGRQLTLGQPLVYQTRNSATFRLFLIFYTPFLRSDSGGSAQHTIRVEISTVAANAYTYNQTLNWQNVDISPRFGAVQVDFPSTNQWLVRITLDATTNAQQTPPTLFNIMEEQQGSQLYPDSALLAFTGVGSNQIQSFDAMRGSALCEGRLVKIWNGTSFDFEWTNRRAWILRDLLTEPRIGCGHRIPESLFDDDAALDTQTYWSTEAVPASGIPHDQCDILLNDRRPAWDWIKLLLSEGRATLIPSGGQLKLVADRPGNPGLLYSMPGNIIEGSLTHTLGTGQGLLPNTILLQFPDEFDQFRPHIILARAEDTEAEPQREAPPLTAYSLIRYEHAYWMARYQLLRQRLVQRSLQWASPATALVSEPFDRVTIAYDTPDYARGISGFLNSDSSTTRLVLDRPATLETSPSYTVLVRHQGTNVVESRQLNMGVQAGTWGALILATPLDTAPTAGDLWVLGVLGTTLMPLVIEQVNQGTEGTYQLTASEYQAALYEFPDIVGTSPIPSPTPPPEPPPPGISPPSAPILSGGFGGSGTIGLSWTAAILSEGDTLDHYEVYLALDTPENISPVYAEATGPLSFEALTPELFNGYYFVRAVSTLGGAGPFSNAVHTDWQIDSGSDSD